VLMLKALRHREISRLWFGQALSSIGDEIYRVGLTWLAVGLIGANTGYLNAAQAAALMILSFVGGKWADHWEPLRTMVRVDLIRSGIVMIPVVYYYIAPVPLWLLVLVALLLSGLGAFFDPALQTALPRFSPDLQTLRAATGLMSTTTRLARMVGPALVGFLSGVFPPIHFFTLDAISFAISASSVRSLRAMERADGREPVRIAKKDRQHISFTEAIISGFRLVQREKGMPFMMISKAITSGTWNLAYGLGFALLVQELAPNDTRSFGLVIASYGVGNFAGALYFGNTERKHPGLMMFSGYMWLGLGFAFVALAPSIAWIMPAAAFAGFSGPMNELTFVDLVQKRFRIAEMAKVYRLRIATETATTLLLLLISPLILKHLSVRVVISLCGVTWIAAGLIGLLWFEHKDTQI